MKSPDGRYEAVRHQMQEIRMGSPHFGQLEIVGSSFGTVDGEFAEPIAFSDDSRFLAAAELVGASAPSGRVVVFELARGAQRIVLSFRGLLQKIGWEPDGTLVVTTWSKNGGEDTRRPWRAPVPKEEGWWQRLFHGCQNT